MAFVPTGTVYQIRFPSDSQTNRAGATTAPTNIPAAANLGSYHGLGIALSGGKRALAGVAIWAGPIKVRNGGRFRDIAYDFGEGLAPPEELVDVQMTKLWVQGALVQSRSINEGWNTSGDINYVIYPGYDDQRVDPTIEAVEGANNAPAFRGKIVVVFKDFPLHLYSPGNGIPAVKAELVDIVNNSIRVNEFSLSDPALLDDECVIPNWERNHAYLFLTNATDDIDVVVIDMTTNTEIARNRILQEDGTPIDFLNISSSTSGAGYLEPNTSYIVTNSGTGNSRPLHVFDPYSGLILGTFGVGGSSFVDTETTAMASRRRGFVSTSNTMRDLLFAHAGQVSDTIGFYRIFQNGEIEQAFRDTNEILGNSTDGEVIDIVTGDKIGARTDTFRGSGTVFVSRETAIYRIVVPEGLNGDGDPPELAVTDTPVHETEASDPVTGESFPGRYTDSNAFVDITNGSVTPPDPGPSMSATIDLSTDLGDATSLDLDSRVVAYIDFGSERVLQGVSYAGFGANGLGAGYQFQFVTSSNSTTWTVLDAPAAISDGEFRDQTSGSGELAEAGIENRTPTLNAPRYLGIAMKQADYTGVSDLELTSLSFHGDDGFELSDGSIVFPPFTVPEMIRLWDAPDGHTILMTWVEPRSEDIIVLYENDADSVQSMARLKLLDTIRGNPLAEDPAGEGVTEEWVLILEQPVTTINEYRHALEFSDLSGNSLGIVDAPNNLFSLFTLSTGHQRVIDFNTWRFSTSDTDEIGAITIERRHAWGGTGQFILGQGAGGASDFDWSKLLPYLTDVDGYPFEDLLRWLALRVGYEPDEIETTGFDDDTFIGVILTERTPFRDLIRNLERVYDFKAFESEGKIKFVKKGKGSSFAVDFVLDADDLSPIEDKDEGKEPNDPAATVERDPSLDRPGQIELRFIDPNADYIYNNATYKRTNFPVATTRVDNTEPVTYAIPIVMMSDEARLRVSRMLADIWNAQARLIYRLPTKFLTMEPADIVQVPVGVDSSDSVTYTVSVDTEIINSDHSLSVTVSDVISSEEPDSIGSQDAIPGNDDEIQGPSSSLLAFADIPPLVDTDVTNAAGEGLTFFSAVVSAGQGQWDGGSLYFRVDGEPNFQQIYENGQDSSAAGRAISTLPKGDESTQDFDNTLRVSMTTFDDSFVTITDTELQDGGNLALYGRPGRWEVIQVQTVTQVNEDIYDLTDIVRGLRATENASGRHETNDIFVLLQRPPVTLNALASYAQLGEEAQAKGVGLGEEENVVLPDVFTMTGTFERMFPVTNLTATDDSGDVIFAWDRRSRLFSTLVDDTTFAPTEETAEGYELEIHTSGESLTPVRTITDIGETQYRYPAADGVSDFGAMPSSFFVRIYHMSSEVGRGTPLIASVDVE